MTRLIRPIRSRFVLASALLLGAPIAFGADRAPEPNALDAREHDRYFEQSVRPLLVENCYSCHGPKKQKGGLRLDSRKSILQGGESGPAVVVGKPGESPLIEAVNYAGLEMPPTGKLDPAKIDVLTRWVAMGLPWPAGTESPATEKEAERPSAVPGVSTRKKSGIDDQDRAFWSFQPLRKIQPPDPLASFPAGRQGESHAWDDWTSGPIDRFVLKGMLDHGLTPTSEADRRTLIRRLSFDLIGLPPSPEEVDAFLNDSTPDAYERLVERLLASPQYGERWARHWLDLVRYAESDGHRLDSYRPDAWRYRDYVIRSFNADKPYDRFLAEQLAGDEIDPNDLELRIATGYLRLTTYEYNQRNVRGQWADILNDLTDVTGEVFLGLSIGCARCHDHKFDPILQKDYYRLQAFFTPLLPRDDLGLETPASRAAYEKSLAAWERATASIRAELEKIEKPHREAAAQQTLDRFPDDMQPVIKKSDRDRTPFERQLFALAYRQVTYEFDRLAVKGPDKVRWDALRKKLKKFDAIKPAAPQAVMAVTDIGAVSSPTVIPGDRKQTMIEPGFPSVLDPSVATIVKSAAAPNSTGRRLALAKWLGRPDNPLTTRVIVNRVWQYHFGRGLVATSSDFGRLGEAPTHPELLDYLASMFVEGGWSLKKLHRAIVTSSVYRQSATPSSAAAERDPSNLYLSRFSTRRLEAEQMRDAALAASGELERVSGGPSVEPIAPRRSIVTKIIRNTPDPLLIAFDGPDGSVPASLRVTTTTPTQALLLLNGPWTLARSQAFAVRLERQVPAAEDRSARIALAYRLAFGRAPEPDEIHSATEFLDRQERLAGKPGAASAHAALVDFCHALLNANEFLYVE